MGDRLFNKAATQISIILSHNLNLSANDQIFWFYHLTSSLRASFTTYCPDLLRPFTRMFEELSKDAETHLPYGLRSARDQNNVLRYRQQERFLLFVTCSLPEPDTNFDSFVAKAGGWYEGYFPIYRGGRRYQAGLVLASDVEGVPPKEQLGTTIPFPWEVEEEEWKDDIYEGIEEDRGQDEQEEEEHTARDMSTQAGPRPFASQAPVAIPLNSQGKSTPSAAISLSCNDYTMRVDSSNEPDQVNKKAVDNSSSLGVDELYPFNYSSQQQPLFTNNGHISTARFF
ncbi:hypothetical protein VKT23_015785 [Stygiomarasmius scandens]|uniref:Uncharacterized protein n=1 Tax=Marasmiellus scandens TaxID=2682957 RepID=A0ABR1IWP2_9AGAR